MGATIWKTEKEEKSLFSCGLWSFKLAGTKLAFSRIDSARYLKFSKVEFLKSFFVGYVSFPNTNKCFGAFVFAIKF